MTLPTDMECPLHMEPCLWTCLWSVPNPARAQYGVPHIVYNNLCPMMVIYQLANGTG